MITIGMKLSPPVAVALAPDATAATPAEVKEAVNAIAGAEILDDPVEKHQGC
jgi:hypothetical protein